VTPGASVVVTLADESEVVFRVTRIEQMAKADLPRDEMFARNGPARLTLVTCGGTFNPDRHRYDDNIIVFADLA
jgi:Sortase domain